MPRPVAGQVVDRLAEGARSAASRGRGGSQAEERHHEDQADEGEHGQGKQHGLVTGHSERPYRPRTIRRIRSQRSLTAASAPSEVGW